MGVVANARLTERPDKSADAQAEMLQRAGRLQLARELGHAPQRVAAALADEAMLGVRSWITLLPRQLEPGKEEALCLWLNSTPGLLLRILCANRPYLGRSAVPHEVARDTSGSRHRRAFQGSAGSCGPTVQVLGTAAAERLRAPGGRQGAEEHRPPTIQGTCSVTTLKRSWTVWPGP